MFVSLTAGARREILDKRVNLSIQSRFSNIYILVEVRYEILHITVVSIIICTFRSLLLSTY